MGTEMTWSEILVLDTPAVETIGKLAFQYVGRELYLPKLREAGNYLFNGAQNLKEVNFPKLKAVSYKMFSDCYILRNVKLDSAESVDADAFADCYLLKNIYMPELKHLINVNEPDEGTFYRCFNLTEVSFPLVQEIPELVLMIVKNLLKQTLKVPFTLATVHLVIVTS